MPIDQVHNDASTEKMNGASEIGMASGRLCVVPGENTFLREALLTVFRRTCAGKRNPRHLAPPKVAGSPCGGEVYRGQIGSDFGKQLRWQA